MPTSRPIPSTIAATMLFGLIPLSMAQQPDTAKERPLGTGVRCVAFSQDGAFLAAALGEPKERGLVVVWDVAARKQLWSHAEDDGVPAVDFSPDGKTLAIGTYDSKALLLDAATGRVVKKIEGHTNTVRAVAISPDGKTLATGAWDKSVRLWDIASGAESMSLEWPEERVYGISFSPGGKWLMATGGVTRVWDVVTGTEKQSSKSRSGDAAVFVDDEWYLAAGNDGTVRLWNVATGEQPPRLRGSFHKISYAPKTGLLAAAPNFRGDIAIYDFNRTPTPEQKERIRALLILLDDDDYETREKAGQDLLAIGFTAEAEIRRVMKESGSTEVRIRSRRLHDELLSKTRATLVGHTEHVDGLAFTRDGRLLASGGKDGSVRLWNMSDFQEVARLVPLSLGRPKE